jgi:hypothetical protein
MDASGTLEMAGTEVVTGDTLEMDDEWLKVLPLTVVGAITFGDTEFITAFESSSTGCDC